MAEFASGAVNTLLGVIRNEAQLLGGVENDVQFIKEEMESMSSFLQHLARKTPPGGEHDEQVRAWMKQVRELANDCSNCIDKYLQRGDPAVVRRARGNLGYLWRAIPWYLQKLYAQHRAATQLRELKNRARDVGERRRRYGVEIPTSKKKTTTTTIQAPTPGATSPSQAQTAGGGDEGTIPGDDEQTPKDEAVRNLAFSEARILEECTQNLVDWLGHTKDYQDPWPPWLIGTVDRFRAIAIAAPDEENGADVASEAWAHPLLAACNFDHKFWITSKYRSWGWWRIEPLDILRQIQQDILPGERQDQLEDKLNEKIQDIADHTDTENIKKHLLGVAAGKRSCTAVPLEPLDILHDILESLEKGESAKDPVDATDKSGEGHQMDERITETAKKLKSHLESGTEKSSVGLHHSEYEDILRKQLLLRNPKEDTPVKERAMEKPDEDQITKNIKEIMKKMKGDILRELKPQEDKLREDQVAENIKEDNSEKEGMDELDEDQMLDEKINEITWEIRRTLENIKEHLLIKEAVEKIKGHLKDKTTLIVLDGHDYVHKWGKTKKALNMLECATGSAVIVLIAKEHPKWAKKFSDTTDPPISYSLVGFYHSKVLSITSQEEQQEQDYNVDIYRRILKKCEPHEFCMKIFTRALYFNRNRSKQELDKLRDTLVFRWESGWDTNARKMLEFSYSVLPREYKTCLLYLAIFPLGDKIRRSSLVGRWVAEGLVTKEDWPSSVLQAEQCFDALIDLWFVYPGDVGAAGKIKSCIVHDIVHDFITNIARKEHLLETRLSHHHARHFSVLSDIRIRSSDKIEMFLRKLHVSPQFPLVKVLDLEGCELVKMKQRYLKNICNKMILLKYLSLRNIHITKLPREINNLHQLEVLDIRQTGVDASTTKSLMLLKLKRLLASCNNIDPTITDNINRTKESFNTVKLPRGIEKMTNMEVLSHVEASEGLKDIGKLWQLRKLGVVIHNKEAHLKELVTVIGDLSKSLQSLSISINPVQDSSHGTPSNKDIGSINPNNLLESLSIRGKTSGWLLPLLVKYCDKLVKITLHNTSLNQDNMRDLGELPKLRCVRLQHESYTESNLTFKKEEFQNLKFLIVEGCNLTGISFEDEAAPNLEKIDLSSTNMNNISFGSGAANQLEKIILSSINIISIKFGNGAAPELEEVTLSSANITSITFDNRDTPNLKKIVSSSSNMEFLSIINKLPGLKEVELNDSGITSASLHSLFNQANRITKVILRGTLLKQGDLQILAMQPNMRCLELQENSCDVKQLTFKKDEFRKLNLLIVECRDITNINFADGAAPKLKKIVWSFNEMESLSGIDKLPELKELEFKGVLVPYQVRQDINAHTNRNELVFKHNKPDKAKESAAEADDTRRFPFCWKKKD